MTEQFEPVSEVELLQLIGRDYETIPSGPDFQTQRGPIESIKIQHFDVHENPWKYVELIFKWIAVKTPNGWEQQIDSDSPENKFFIQMPMSQFLKDLSRDGKRFVKGGNENPYMIIHEAGDNLELP